MYELKTVDGIYREGNVQLREVPGGIVDGTPAIVTFLTRELAFDRPLATEDSAKAAMLPALAKFATGWHSPELEIYHDRERSDSAVLM